MNHCIKSIKRQYKSLFLNPESLFSVELTDNIYIWNILFFGPQDTIYENGIFTAQIIFPKDFPNSPPSC
jgi:ubiquitin-conjugating enzyme E2 G1